MPKKSLSSLKYVEVLPDHLNADPTKIVFSLRQLGLTGLEVERILRVDYNIQVELSDYYNVLALISLGDTLESVERLVQAVGDLAARRAHLGRRPLPCYTMDFPELPPAVLSLREGFFQDKELIPWNKPWAGSAGISHPLSAWSSAHRARRGFHSRNRRVRPLVRRDRLVHEGINGRSKRSGIKG